MRFFTFHFMLLCIVSGMWAGDVKLYQPSSTQSVQAESRVKSYEITVKFSPELWNRFDLQRAQSEGLTGVDAVDQLAAQLPVARIYQQFPRAKSTDIYGRPMNLLGWFKIRFSTDVDVYDAVQKYKLINGVQDAQVIGIHPVDLVTPNDPNYTNGDMWYLNQSQDHDVDAPEAWDINRGNASIIVADLDSGFRYYHKDLGGANAAFNNKTASRGNMWINDAELNGTANVDDDGNGYVDDWIGWDFVTGNPQNFDVGDDYDVEDNDPSDHNGHGTHTMGSIAAISNNGYAVSSISGGNGETNGQGNGVKGMCLRIGWDDFLGLGFVGMDFAANAFIYAADNGAKIANCSWGSSNTGGLAEAIDYYLYGTTTPTGNEPQLRLIFKAAGNDNNEQSDYMLDRSDVIGVAATDSNDVKASFSTYGTFVDISSPGEHIMSTYHDNTDDANDYVAFLDGTSMATPICASVAALVWSHNNALTATEVEQILYNTADDIESIPGNSSYIGKLGAGRVNAFAAVNQADQTLPVELTSFTASARNGAVVLNWSTASEIDNMGFAVYRSTSQFGDYEKLADFNDYDALRGLGTSSQGQDYHFTDNTVNVSETYWYILKDIDVNGVETEHGPISVFVSPDAGVKPGQLPVKFELSGNYPNPFNPETHFTLSIPALKENGTDVRITIYDLLGKKVKELYAGHLQSGVYNFTWNGTNDNGHIMPSGMYIYRVITNEFQQSRKMVLM
ncbi:MAG: T9SS C-terminal target domain-containing protein, partial [Calditrichaeota bacterium]